MEQSDEGSKGGGGPDAISLLELCCSGYVNVRPTRCGQRASKGTVTPYQVFSLGEVPIEEAFNWKDEVSIRTLLCHVPFGFAVRSTFGSSTTETGNSVGETEPQFPLAQPGCDLYTAGARRCYAQQRSPMAWSDRTCG
jgi:hypothetical protein